MSMLKSTALLLTLWLAIPFSATASLPELKLSPLEIQEHLELGHPKIGYVEASNPTSTTAHITIEVQAFRQINDRGQLDYYNDQRIVAGIVPAQNSFDLGARETVRLKFSVDPNKLGPGGAYGVIFMRVTSGEQAASQINTSARIGTLLILDVAGKGTKSGQLTNVSINHAGYGATQLGINFNFKNTGSGQSGLAYAPALQFRLGWSGPYHDVTGPFVFPGRTRVQTINLNAGSHVGLVPFRIEDIGSGHITTRWLFIVSGDWTWRLPIILMLISLVIFLWYKRRALTGRRGRRLRHKLGNLLSQPRR
jgi:hypothetical protein